LKKKYGKYLDNNAKPHIVICFDEIEDSGDLEIGGKKFNYNTLEPKLLKVNSFEKMNEIFDTSYSQIDDLYKYMNEHKTECALKIFDTEKDINFPQYILDAIKL